MPRPPSPLYALVPPGGAVRFLPAAVALNVMQRKAAGDTSVALDWPSPCLMDCASIERIDPFESWQEQEQVKLASARRHICPYGTVHDESDACRCMKAGKMPLTTAEAAVVLERGRRYAALDPSRRSEYISQSGDALEQLQATGYFREIAQRHALPLLN